MEKRSTIVDGVPLVRSLGGCAMPLHRDSHAGRGRAAVAAVRSRERAG